MQVYQEKGLRDKERYRSEMLEYKSSYNSTTWHEWSQSLPNYCCCCYYNIYIYVYKCKLFLETVGGEKGQLYETAGCQHYDNLPIWVIQERIGKVTDLMFLIKKNKRERKEKRSLSKGCNLEMFMIVLYWAWLTKANEVIWQVAYHCSTTRSLRHQSLHYS